MARTDVVPTFIRPCVPQAETLVLLCVLFWEAGLYSHMRVHSYQSYCMLETKQEVGVGDGSRGRRYTDDCFADSDLSQNWSLF